MKVSELFEGVDKRPQSAIQLGAKVAAEQLRKLGLKVRIDTRVIGKTEKSDRTVMTVTGDVEEAAILKILRKNEVQYATVGSTTKDGQKVRMVRLVQPKLRESTIQEKTRHPMDVPGVRKKYLAYVKQMEAAGKPHISFGSWALYNAKGLEEGLFGSKPKAMVRTDVTADDRKMITSVFPNGHNADLKRGQEYVLPQNITINHKRARMNIYKDGDTLKASIGHYADEDGPGNPRKSPIHHTEHDITSVDDLKKIKKLVDGDSK